MLYMPVKVQMCHALWTVSDLDSRPDDWRNPKVHSGVRGTACSNGAGTQILSCSTWDVPSVIAGSNDSMGTLVELSVFLKQFLEGNCGAFLILIKRLHQDKRYG